MSRDKIAIFHNVPGGGSARLILELYKNLKKTHLVDIYSIRELGAMKLPEFSTVEETVTHVKPWPGFLLRNLWIVMVLPFIHKNLAKKINSLNYSNILINHDIFTKAPYLLRYVESRKIYLLHEPPREFYEPVEYHAPYWKDKIANGLRIFIKIIDRHNTRKSDIIVCNSNYSKKIIKQVYNRESLRIYPGVDTIFFKPSKKIKKKQILLIGGYTRVKGHDFVLRSLKKIIGEYKILIIGDGREEDLKYLKTFACGRHKHVVFKNFVNINILKKHYQESIILCIGAFREPLGLTSLEAQSCGLPVVALNEGGIPETISNGESGYYTVRQERKFFKAVQLAIKNAETLSKKARKIIVSKWKWDNYFSQLDKLLR